MNVIKTISRISLCFVVAILMTISQVHAQSCETLPTDSFGWDGQLVLVTSNDLILMSENDMMTIEFDVSNDLLFDGYHAWLSPDNTWIAVVLFDELDYTYITLYNFNDGQTLDYYIGDRTVDDWFDNTHLMISPQDRFIFETELLNIITGEYSLAVDWDLLSLPPIDMFYPNRNYWSLGREEYSPNGNYAFYYTDEGQNLVIVDLALDAVIWSRYSPLSATFLNATWNPNNDSVVFIELEPVQSLSGEPSIDNDLYMVDIATGTTIQLYDGYVTGDTPTWSPSGERLAFYGLEGELSDPSCVVIIDFASEPPTYTSIEQRNANDLTWISENILAYNSIGDISFINIEQRMMMHMEVDLPFFHIVGWLP